MNPNKVRKVLITGATSGIGYQGAVQLIKEGNGTLAINGKTVSVHFTGKLTDGTKFDSSYDRDQPIEFVLGQGRVIKGWDEGISYLKVGGKATFIIPANLAYGERGAGGVIPPNATYTFENHKESKGIIRHLSA